MTDNSNIVRSHDFSKSISPAWAQDNSPHGLSGAEVLKLPVGRTSRASDKKASGPRPLPEGNSTRLRAALDNAEAQLRRFLVLPDNGYKTAVLWAVATHLGTACEFYPRLIISAPGPEHGKSKTLQCVAGLSRNSRMVGHTTAAALSTNLVEAQGRTTFFLDQAERLGLLKSDHDRLPTIIEIGFDKYGGTDDKSVQDENERWKGGGGGPQGWLALACIGLPMTGTILSRSLLIRLAQAVPPEKLTETGRADIKAAGKAIATAIAPLKSRILSTAVSTKMPEGVRNRAAEKWQYLLAIAEAAGGDWPEEAREIARGTVQKERAMAKATSKTEALLDVLENAVEAGGKHPYVRQSDLVTPLGEILPIPSWSVPQQLVGTELANLGLSSIRKTLGGRKEQIYWRDDIVKVLKAHGRLDEMAGKLPLL